MKTIKKLRNNTASLNIETGVLKIAYSLVEFNNNFCERNLEPEMHPPKVVFITH